MRALVIGGGVAGCTAIVGLRKKDKGVEIVLVEPKDHLEVFWATYRVRNLRNRIITQLIMELRQYF
jgi:protoporphyrinogen oxidase